MPEFPWVDTQAFEMLRTPRSQVGILLLHGFAGTPGEMRPLASRLSAVGLDVYAPALLGHGLRPEALQNVTWQDWVEGARDAYYRVREHHREVVVIGLSMGGMVACLMIHSLPEADRPVALSLLAPALRARDDRLKWAPLLKYVLPWFPEATREQAGLTNPEGWKKLWHYERRPVHALAELHRIQQAAGRILGEIEVPALVVHGLKDQTVPESSARDVYEKLGSHPKELLWLEKSGHCLTADVEIDLVVEEILDFLKRNVGIRAPEVAPRNARQRST